VWKTILSADRQWLIEQIINFEIEPKSINRVLEICPNSTKERAFLTILRNRLNHGGILAEGAGLIKNGENRKGLKSRWYPSTLKKRIENICEIQKRLEFYEGDGLAVIENFLNKRDVVFFIDPPYTQAGRRLYKYHQIDHEQLFNLIIKAKGDFLITYDAAPEIEELALRRNLEVEKVIMKTTHHLKKIELVIGRNLSWLRDMTNE
jgi:DNA adenine methylase